MSTTIQPDIIVESRLGSPVAVIEVKNQRGLDSETATALRRNLIVHSVVPNAQFFALINQENIFLWSRPAEEDTAAPPDIVVPATEILQRYADGIDTSVRLRGRDLELIVYQWLTELTLRDSFILTGVEQELNATGFLTAVRDGTVVLEPRY